MKLRIKANQAVEEIEGIVDDAIAATDKAEEIASNPPKIVDNDWWIYNYDTKQYVNTGIVAVGDAFTYLRRNILQLKQWKLIRYYRCKVR